MTKFYHPKSGAVREIDEDDPSADIKTNALVRAGFKKGNPPTKLRTSALPEETVVPPTEGDETLDESEGPVLAKHASVLSNMQLPEGMTAEGILGALEEYEDGDVFDGLGIDELREIAHENDVTIPFEIRKKTEIAAFLREELSDEELDDEDLDEGGEDEELE